MPLSTIFQLYRGSQFFLVEETGVPGENHWPVVSHWQTLLHNVVSKSFIRFYVIGEWSVMYILYLFQSSNVICTSQTL
jgi:hypothetical protein